MGLDLLKYFISQTVSLLFLSTGLCAETLEVSQNYVNQFTLQADGFLHEAQFDCDSISEDAFGKWQVNMKSDAAYEATVDADGLGGALIVYELAKSKFRRLFQADPADACLQAVSVMSGEVQVSTIDVPQALPNGEVTNAQFYRLGLMDALYKDCQGIVELRHWSPSLSLPSGNFAEGLLVYSLGRMDAKASYDTCKALAQAIN